MKGLVALYIGAGILTAQALASFAVRREPYLPAPPPLAMMPAQIGGWKQLRDLPIDPAALEMLGPDDSLDRTYRLADGSRVADLFVAYYRTQLRAKNAHDPKVCLPGSGWNPQVSRVMQLSFPDTHTSIPVNYYRIAKQDQQEVVLYWFQTHKAVYVWEQELRFHRLLDVITDNRTDMALVRIIVPVDPTGIGAADANAEQFARIVYPQMEPYFPRRQGPGL
jgi:EpsI family protein